MLPRRSPSTPRRPLVGRKAVVELIANTTTREGLAIEAELDEGEYPLGVKVSDEELASVNIRRRRTGRSPC